MNVDIPLLEAADVECRIQSIIPTKDKKGQSAILLLYKNARVDMKVLDQVFGPTSWQRTHELINGNLFCSVDIWDSEKQVWVRKQDVGVESNTEKEKGQASDSFKRACTNIGIGRELYTAPFIYIPLMSDEYESNGRGGYRCKTSTRFCVAHIAYNDRREISELRIADGNGKTRYTFPFAKNQAHQKADDKAESRPNEANSAANAKAVAPASRVENTPGRQKAATDMRINEQMERVVFDHARKAGYSEDQMIKMVKAKYKKEVKDLTLKEYNAICPALEKQAEQLAKGLVDDMTPMFR